MKYPQLVSMPSEISDWLEEQLEARGIDAVVYTRYVISLLNRDSVDIVSPDQDLHFTQLNKEVRRSGSGRKRFRCFSEWREYAQTDVEQLKRSAAIECLMSASDQNWGIESLVDELCEKLKEIKSDPNTSTESTASSINSDCQTISPQDLAKKYYAAFPPLNNNKPAETPSNLVTLIPKCFTSPKKKGARRQNRSASFDDKLHYKVDNDSLKKNNSKQRLGYFSKSRNELGYSRSMAKSMERSESMTDWDLFLFTNNTKNKLGNKSSDKFGNITEEKVTTLQNEVTKEQPKIEDNRHLWNDEESMNICDDLPVDILELLDSPSPRDYTIEMMNLANMRNAGNKNFIQCGTNITTSIWSFDAEIDNSTMFENTFNSSRDQPETILGIKFKSLTVGNNNLESIWSNPSDIEDTDTNFFFENYKKSSFLNSTNSNSFYSDFQTSNPWISAASGIEKFQKWSDAEYFDNDDYLQNVTKSLMKLNHNREESSFMEVIPKSNSNIYNFFNRPISMTHMLPQGNKHSAEKEDENLLTSIHSHFRPINSVNNLHEYRNKKQYADGTSFVISGSLDSPNYKRSDSGSQYLETDYGSPKKLLEYKNKVDKSPKSALVLKFFVHQNDKACQTETMNISDVEMENSQEVPYKKRVMSEPEEFFFPGDEEMLKDEQKFYKYKQANVNETKMGYSFDEDLNNDFKETEKNNVLAEMWKGESKQCEKCNYAKSLWNSNWTKDDSIEAIWQLDTDSLGNIWNGAKVCSSCLGMNGGRLPPNSQQSQLREDISQDGEQLLSDLSILQKSYMEQLPVSEITYDISELITGSKERKRRHSPILEATKNAVPVHRGSWTRMMLDEVFVDGQIYPSPLATPSLPVPRCGVDTNKSLQTLTY
ncbi:hypothetical protein RN001_006065 [Aquatica leii]|uniref:Uncharacterized protein n=1 Tax=Aquatica leii TaxID=1421715 RepID=A0AAN7PHX9_9COLE|nr:hypothetical protein RN001_006065 [Aquatica leii]